MHKIRQDFRDMGMVPEAYIRAWARLVSSWHGGLVAFGLRVGNVITPLALLVHQEFPL
ncbi:MAG: hypothetical protein ACLP8X_38445 [Streptosporangiaceae bacterium]